MGSLVICASLVRKSSWLSIDSLDCKTLGRWRTICIRISVTFWERKDQNITTSLLSANNHRYLWPCHHMLGELPHAKGFLWIMSRPHLLPAVLPPSLYSPGNRVSCLLINSIFLEHFYSSFLLLSLLTSLFFRASLSTFQILKAQSSREEMGWEEEKKKEVLPKVVLNRLIVFL